MAVFLKRESAEKLLELAAKHGGTSQAIEWLINQYCMHQHMRSRRPRQDRTTKKSSSSELRGPQHDSALCGYSVGMQGRLQHPQPPFATHFHRSALQNFPFKINHATPLRLKHTPAHYDTYSHYYIHYYYLSTSL